MFNSRTQTRRPSLLSIIFVTLVLMVTTVVATPSQADALSDFESELMQVINDHRRALNLSPLVEQPSMSVAARNWSDFMNQESQISGCRSPRTMHVVKDSAFNVATQGTPAETLVSDDAVAWTCGYPDRPQPSTFASSGMPAVCYGDLDATTGTYVACLWLNGNVRTVLETADFTHIGVGAIQKIGSRNSRITFATVRLAGTAGDRDPSCADRIATINLQEDPDARGTAGDDVILGTLGDDVIYGGGGNDIICGLDGRDIIVAGDGNDLIFGDEGNDLIYAGGGDDEVHGGVGRDTLRGHEGADELHGGGGSDYIYGGDGADLVLAGSGADRVWGDAGPDELRGMGGQDTMYGGEGNDNIQGNWQSDKIYGGPGDDVLRGAEGKDKIYGEDGDDEMYGGANTDYLDGGAGTDFANGQRGRDNTLVADVSGCIAESKLSC